MEHTRINEVGIQKSYRRIFELAAVYILVAHLGWLFEKLGRFIVYNSLADRGFLSLPLCPIYGTSVLLIYLLFGTPDRMRVLTRRTRVGKIKGIAIYFFASFLLASVVELCIGAFFGEVVGHPLWNYSERFLNIFGYVCLSYSLMWGALMTLFMLFVWRHLDFAVRSLRERSLLLFCKVVYSLVAADFVFNVIYLCVSGSHFDFL